MRGVVIRHRMICRRERWLSSRRFSRPLERGDRPGALRLQVSGQAVRAGADQFLGAANRAPRRGRPRAHGSAQTEAKEIIYRNQTHRRQSACVTPSVACSLGRASSPTTPASPPRRKGACYGGRSAFRISDGTVSLRSRTTAVLRGFPRPPCPSPGNPLPRGRTPAWGQRHSSAAREIDHGLQVRSEDHSEVRPPPASRRSARTVTLEMVQAAAPYGGLAENLSRTFGIEPVDYAAIRENTEEHMVRCANELTDNLNAKAMEIHLQRIAGAFVGLGLRRRHLLVRARSPQLATSMWRLPER